MMGNRGLLLVVIALIVGGLLVFYYSGKENGERPAVQQTEERKAEALEELPEGAEESPANSPELQAPQESLDDILGEGEAETQTMGVEDECERLEREVKEFFAYLDTRDYVKELGLKADTYTRFRHIVRVLSSHPPLPAGEGINYDKIIENIYHFYRVLTLEDLKLLRLVARNEADSMEINLALFYKWLMSGDQCSGDQGLPPSWDVVYRYAGFLINSIGGRAYLFRRDIRLRLLVNYYCLLIIHEADKRKMNSFGIDITPFLEPLAEEIENYQLLYFRKEYAGRLIDMADYYLKRRTAS